MKLITGELHEKSSRHFSFNFGQAVLMFTLYIDWHVSVHIISVTYETFIGTKSIKYL
jgi:hypothetical protein